jgi:hypothetical protein
LFQPQKEIDPYTGVAFEGTRPALHPVTGNPRINPETGEMLVAFVREESPEERTKRIELLAREWVEQYFRTLRNHVSNSTDATE